MPRKLQSQQTDAAQICVTLPAFPTLADPHCPDVVVHHGGWGERLLPLQQKTALQSLACPPRTPGIHTAAGRAGPKTHPYSIVPGGASRLATAQAALEATLGVVPFLGLSFNLQLKNSGLQFWLSECWGG